MSTSSQSFSPGEPAEGLPETRILLVDDDAALRAATARILTAAGYAVSEAASGAEGLRLAAELRPALVLMDVVLPDRSGIEVCQRIKADPQLTSTHVILLSALRTSPDDRSQGLESGADDYIPRPVSNRELLGRVRAMLRIRDVELQLRLENARYRRLFEEAPVLQVITRNQDGQPIIEECNQLWLSALGYTRAEVIGRPLADFYTPESRRALLDEGGYQRALAGRLTSAERQLLTRDGRVIHTLLTAVSETDAEEQVCGTRAMFTDISVRKQAEEALRESERRFRRLAENAQDLIYRYRLLPDRGFEYVSPAATRITGYTPEDHYADPDLGFKLVHPEDRHMLQYLTEDEANWGRPVEFRWRHKDGHTIWTEQINTPIYDDSGCLIAIKGIARDISKRKQAEEARRTTERELRRRNRELTLLNRIILASATDVAPEWLLQLACDELADTLSAPLVVALLADERTPDTFRAVAESRAPDQSTLVGASVQLSNHPILREMRSRPTTIYCDDVQADPRFEAFTAAAKAHRVRSLMILPLHVEGHLIGFLNLAAHEPRRFAESDIELAQAVARQLEVALARVSVEQAHRRLAAAIEQSAESIIVTDVDANIVYVNPAFEAITGYSRAEALGKNPRFLKSGRQDAEFYRQMWATLTAGQVWHGRMTNRRKDGTLYTEDATISPVHDEYGVLVNYVGVKRDITREMELEEQFLRAQKMEAVGRLTAGIAHDFNNLLTAINGFAELLAVALPPDHPARDMAVKIQGAGKRAAELVSQLLAYSRKQMIQPQVLDLTEVVAGMDKMLQRIIGEDIELVTTPGAGLWAVNIDRTQIEQVIVNLAVNARDVMPHGGRLTIETTNVTLDAAYVGRHLGAEMGDHVMLAITDTGVGMSPEVQSRIFEPYFTTKEVGKGTGLGLAAVYGIVKQNHGNIWVYSEEGQGTTFKIYLPRATQAVAQSAQPTALADLPSGNETILLAEDSDVVRDLAVNVLRRQGYRVIEACDGSRALQAAADYDGPIHLLITDVVMPGMSGRALADQLLQQHPTMKVLFMSGYTENAILHHGVLHPGTALLEKPFTPPALARRVRRILDGDN